MRQEHLGRPLNEIVSRNGRWGPMTHLELARGEGRGVITQDGCAVELYLKLPYRGELELLAGQLTPRCSVLELGCGTGRLTRHLLDKGHSVTAVDNSTDMLRHVPEAASKICCDIERLELGCTFDVVLLASNLINIGDDSMRRAQLMACRQHLSPRGSLVFQRFDPAWLRAVQPGPFPSIGEIEITIERVVRDGNVVHMSIRYAMEQTQWMHHFTARILDDDDVRLGLLEAGFGAVVWIDTKWGAATKHENAGEI
jgi:SAM-dependent methyltransferase